MKKQEIKKILENRTILVVLMEKDGETIYEPVVHKEKVLLKSDEDFSMVKNSIKMMGFDVKEACLELDVLENLNKNLKDYYKSKDKVVEFYKETMSDFVELSELDVKDMIKDPLTAGDNLSLEDIEVLEKDLEEESTKNLLQILQEQ